MIDAQKAFESLIRRVCALPAETEWLEFKVNNSDPERIAEYISALGNSAALFGVERAFMIWGIEDESHRIVGTNFDPWKAKRGNEGLENWLHRQLHTNVDFQFEGGEVDGKALVVLTINPAVS